MFTRKNELCGTCDAHKGGDREYSLFGDDAALCVYVERCYGFGGLCCLLLE